MRDEIRKPSYRDVLDQAPAVLTADILTKASQPSFEGLPLKAQDYLAGLNTAAARGNISYHRCAEDLVGKLSDGRLPAGFDRTDVCGPKSTTSPSHRSAQRISFSPSNFC